VRGTCETFSSGGQQDVVTNVTVSQIRINDANFSKDLFHVDFLEGTLIQDLTAKIEWTVGDFSRTRVIDDLRHILEDINRPQIPEMKPNEPTNF
jgi:hypothetical protein